jgi:hypothetical protein
MGDPDLYSDESIRLTAGNIIVKSAPFDAILTNKRIILVDIRKKHIPQQTILLATVRTVEMGENAIRDPVITLSVMTNTGSTRQMLLTFSKKAGGDRRRECEDWVKALKEATASQSKTFSTTVPAPSAREPKPEPEVIAPPQIRMTSTAAVKKNIEIARPIKKIVETGPVPPKPIETSSLPEGAFCSRCGNRVPPGSTFCNHCGTKVVLPGEQVPLAEPAPPATPVPAPVVSPAPAPTVEPPVAPASAQGTPVVWPVITPVTSSTPPSPPIVSVPTPPVRPIEEVIHSIEPLIEDSVPRTEPAPLIGKDMTPLPGATGIPETSGAVPAQPPLTPPAGDGGAQVPKTPVPPSSDAPSPVPPSLPPVPEFRPAAKKPRGLVIAAIAILAIVVIAAVFVFANPFRGTGTPGVTITPTPTATIPVVTTASVTTAPTTSPPVTTLVTTLPTTPAQPRIPATGVWIRITYTGMFSGTYGTPGLVAEVTSTGDRLYQVATDTGPVVASIKKQDGSGDKLTVAVYKDGELMKTASTTAPSGTLDFLAEFKNPTPTPVPTTVAPTAVTTTSAPGTNVTATQTTASV